MKLFLKTFAILFLAQSSFAQYTEVINSRRPGFSDSPYSLGTKVYQVEGGLFYKNLGNFLYWDADQQQAVEYGSTGIGTDVMLRTGQFFEKLEINLDMALVSEQRDYTRPTAFSDSGFGFAKLTLGAKYLVYKPTYKDKSKEIRSWKKRHQFDTRRLIPAVGVYAGLNTNLLMDLYKNPDGMSPRFALFTQNDLSDKMVVLFNFIMDKAFTDEAENSYIVTATYAINERWSIFGENQGFFRKNVPNDFQFGAGGAYLINKDMQADLSARMIFDERGDNSLLVGGGLSWRLDRHKDKIIFDKNVNDEELGNEKRSFFHTITFGLFAGNKSYKNKGKMKSVKPKKAKTRSLEPPVNKKAAKARKKQNKKFAKEQKKREKAQKKYNKKAEKN